MKEILLISLLALITSCNTVKNGDKGSALLWSECLRNESSVNVGFTANGDVSMTPNSVCTNEVAVIINYEYFNGKKYPKKLVITENGRITNELMIK